MRSSPSLWGIAVLLLGLSATQALRLSRDGMPLADAITAITVFIVVVMGTPLLIFALLGARNRRLLAALRQSVVEPDSLYPIFYSRELRDVLSLVSSATGPEYGRHGVLQVSESGIRIWVSRKESADAPELAAEWPWVSIESAVETLISIEGGGFTGLSIDTTALNDSGVVSLPIGVANTRVGAFFPSRGARRSCLSDILAFIPTTRQLRG